MFQYDNQNRKVPVEHYKQEKKVRFANTKENYGNDEKGGCPKWLWIVLAVVAVVLVLVLVVSMLRKRSSKSVRLPDATAGFGFRFY